MIQSNQRNDWKKNQSKNNDETTVEWNERWWRNINTYNVGDAQIK